MVVNRGDIKRKRKDDACINLLDESPKRTKVHAQRKFAQGSNVSSPVITPVKEIERQDRNKDVLPEPTELLPIKRPNTEDFLTFLCFRGTPILPPNLNFFNTASMINSQIQTDEPKNMSPKNGPIITTAIKKNINERPFIAFGVRKRADPIIISKQMDKKRRHALTLQALRRKYQEQKMAKIRAVTISKLSEKITSKSVVRTRSVTKNETVTKKSITQKTKVKVVATKRVTIKQPIRTNIKSKMCLRSFRGRYIHHELSVRSHKKKQIPKSYVQHKRVTKKIAKKAEATSSEFSSDDDEPLVKAAKVKSNKNNASKVAKKSASGLKKATEVNYRLTRSNNRVISNQLSPRKQAIKRKRFFTKTSSNIRSASSKIKRKIIKSPQIKRNKDKKQVTETLTPVKKEVVEKKMTRAIKKGEKSSANNQITEHILRSSEAKKIGKMDQEKVKKLESKISKTEQKHKLRLKNDEVSKQANVEEKKKVSKEKITKVNEMHITKKEEHIKPIEKIVETEIHIGRKEEHKKIEKPKQEKMLQESVKVEKEHPMENAKKTKPEFEKAVKVIKSDDPKDKILEKKSTESINKIAERKSDEPKSNKTTERKFDDAKNKAVERKSAESNLSTSRPSRKTKEAAAIYMEILGHKLVNDTEIDDDNVSIDSFPELPNVRKTEQRENELKAKAKSKSYKTITKKQSAIEQVQIEKQGHEKILPERATDILEQIIGITMQKNKDKVAENLKSKESSIDEKKINKTLLDENKPNESLLDEKKINKIVLDDKKIDKMALDEKKTNKATRDEKKTNKLSIDEKNTNKTVIDEAKTKEVFVDETKVNRAQTDEKEMCKPALVKKCISKTPLDEKQEISSKRKPNQNDKLDVNSEADVNLFKSKVPRKTEELCTVHDAYNVSKLDNRERRQTRNLGSKQVLSFSDSNESFGLADASENMNLKKINISNILEIKPNICLSDIKNELTKPTFNLNTSDTKEKPVNLTIKDCSSVELDKPHSLKKNERLKKKTKTQRLKIDAEPDFSDSDEEPLAKLTKSKAKLILEADAKCKPIKSNNKKLENKPEILKFQNKGKLTKEKVDDKMFTEKPKRECTKKPQNYMPLFSSSDDEEKYFHGFVKTEPKTLKEKNDDEKCVHSLASSDLLCKDISRRFGKGKVNMSNEQIEKWLNDSAMAGINIKKENDEMLKFGEKIPSEISLYSSKLKTVNTDENNVKDVIIKTKDAEETCSTSFNSTPEKQIVEKPSIKPILNERKTIFRKEKSAPKRNINAFSVSNESSVYAFEADNEDSVNTPFRRPSRRPSSTTTSKSEDEVSKVDDVTKNSGKFRLPALIKTDLKSPNKNETPLISESTNSNSNIDQVNLESLDTQNQTSDNDRVLYIPLQSSKQSLRGVMGSEKKARSTENSGAKPKSTIPCMQKLDEKPLSMFPPAHVLQKCKNDNKTHKSAACKAIDRLSETSDDYKYKVPNSPSASSSSSAKLYNKRVNAKTRNRTLELCTSVNVAEFPNSHTFAQMVDAPVFHPTEKEFQDPIEYIEKIRAKAERFGICRIVPPSTFKPECKVSDDMRFTAYNQYVHKMLHRWGPNFKELMAIKKYLQTQNITLTHPPWIGGMEIDLPRLYQTVQSLGGLKEVIEKKKWPKVSEAMKIPKSAQDRVTKLDDIYCKYLLPYDTLSPAEREKLFDEVETEWAKRESKTLQKVQQKVNKSDTASNASDSDSGDESEECIVKGRNMALNAFYRIARNTMSMWFKTVEPHPQEVEQEFWKHVTLRNNHICVHSGSIDSGSWGYGFAVTKNSPFARHAWNLKVLTNNSGSILRSMGPLMGVTVPTLHVGMVFSACCWYRDPHSLPWIEYLHTGANKIWYGIPDSMSEHFHKTLLKLVPNYCRNKSLWLPSDTVMIPPNLLVENGVSLCRTVQAPGQYIVVFPKVFTSSISTGYVVSESVYFAPPHWLQTGQKVFNELRNSCEPSMFSIDRLILSISSDPRSNIEVLKLIIPAVQVLCDRETKLREKLRQLGLSSTEKLPLPETPAVRKRKKLQDDNGDYECEICRTNLFISLVTESQDDAVYCLEHTIENLENEKIQIGYCKLLYTYDDGELGTLVEKIRSTIEFKQQKKIPGKYGNMPTLLK